MGEVIEFPKRKLCWGCDHAYTGVHGVYCGLFQEHIDDETIAETCEAYTP